MKKWQSIIVWFIVFIVVASAVAGLFIKPPSPQEQYFQEVNNILGNVPWAGLSKQQPVDRYTYPEILVDINQVHARLLAISPPPTRIEIHRKILAFSQKCIDMLPLLSSSRVIYISDESLDSCLLFYRSAKALNDFAQSYPE